LDNSCTPACDCSTIPCTSTPCNWIEYKYDVLGNLTDKIPHGDKVITITPTSNAGGSIIPSIGTYFAGSAGSFNIQSASDYIIANVTIDGLKSATIASNNYSVSFASVNHSLIVDFEPSQDIITFTAGPNGSISGPTSQAVSYNGSTLAVTAIPAPSYHFVNWTGTGGFVTTTSSQIIVNNVTTTQNITANFSLNQCTLQPVRIARATPLYYDTLQHAYNACVSGDVIQAQGLTFVDNITTNLPINVTITGGYACDYGPIVGMSIIKGAPQIIYGSVTLGNFVISN